MKSLSEMTRLGRTIRALGVDDAPFVHRRGERANVSGIVCAGVSFEGMLWGEVEVDGEDATAQLIALIKGSKFHAQLHVVLLDGLALGGFNLVDLPALQGALDRPCVAVMRRRPDLARVDAALKNFEDYERRAALVRAAGPIHDRFTPHVFQCVGASPGEVAAALSALTTHGHVPEALRLAHLIGAAVKTGSSSQRA